jgi:cystathionine gamma-synthase
MKIETIAVHAGEWADRHAGGLADPIQLSTTFEREEDGSYPHGYLYARNGNPNRRALEECLAALEGGAAAASFASGMAAATAIFQALAPGDHVVAPSDAYYGTGLLLRDLFERWGLVTTFVDMTDPAAPVAAVRPGTRLVWIETPTNPMMRIVDIAAIAAGARERGAVVVCDNTFATPVLQRPFELGADLILHSTTKYLGGHSDVLGGAVVAREEGELFARIREIQVRAGAVASPFDCWLTMRGIRTLPWRIRAQSDGAGLVARYLAAHPAVERVHYPGLASHPGHAIAARQMRGFGGMLSVQVVGDAARAMEVASRVAIFTRATSLGGVHSLIEHRASIEGPGSTTPGNLLRLSIGLEHPDDLIEDLEHALG